MTCMFVPSKTAAKWLIDASFPLWTHSGAIEGDNREQEHELPVRLTGSRANLSAATGVREGEAGQHLRPCRSLTSPSTAGGFGHPKAWLRGIPTSEVLSKVTTWPSNKTVMSLGVSRYRFIIKERLLNRTKSSDSNPLGLPKTICTQ